MLKEKSMATPETEQSVAYILSIILNKDSFTFNNEHFLQIHGTAVGFPIVPTYCMQTYSWLC
jgi:hypothetical protein